MSLVLVDPTSHPLRLHPPGIRPRLIQQRLGKFVPADHSDAERRIGEQFPTLINDVTGLPLRLALHWAFGQRRHGFSADTMGQNLRHLGALYYALDRHKGIDLDALILRGEEPSLTHISDALTEIEESPYDPDRVFVRRRSAAGIRTMSPKVFNRMATVWCSFLQWCMNPANYRTGQVMEQTVDAFRDRKIRELQWVEWFANPINRRAVESREKRVTQRLTAQELASVEAVLAPDSVSGKLPSTFGRATRFRNYVLYETVRWFGLRISEALKLKTVDVPGVPDPERRSPRLPGDERLLMIWRRKDDPEDTRTNPPQVKTRERALDGPDSLMEDLQRYVTSRPPLGRRASHINNGYLFVDAADGEPLATQTAQKLIKQIGSAAADHFESQYPGERHTLRDLRWHRLRHTRALELIPTFYDTSSLSVDDFILYFGWSSIRSAFDYIDEFRKQRTNQGVRAHIDRLDERASARLRARPLGAAALEDLKEDSDD